MLFVEKGTKNPDHLLAFTIVEKCVQKGVMLYAPLGPGGGTIKINPPLVITEEALLEGLDVFAQALTEARAQLNK